MGSMFNSYRNRRRRWAIEVTYPSGVVRRFGPLHEKRLAQTYMETRMVPVTYVDEGHRSVVSITSARVVRLRRQEFESASALLGVRLRLP